jgi:hypothetical protein
MVTLRGARLRRAMRRMRGEEELSGEVITDVVDGGRSRWRPPGGEEKWMCGGC